MAPRIASLLLLVTGAFAAAIPAQAVPPPPQTKVVSNQPDHHALPNARIRKVLHDYNSWLSIIERHKAVAGLATAIVVNGRVRYERTLGYADTRSGELVKPTTVFRLASLSKAFATATAGLLVRDGRLSWDSKLINLLPFFKLINMQQAAQATVGDILGQRLGLPRNTFDLKLEDEVPYEQLVRQLNKVKLVCQVGQCYGYQNVAFSLIGDVIYARTGDFFAHQVEKRLFLPLGMTTATYGLQGLENSKSWARPHRRTRRGWVPFMPNENYYRVAPAAGVNASLRDMEQWLLAQMGYRPDVLPATLLNVLHAPGIKTPSETWATPWRRARVSKAWYALGWRVYDYAGHRVIFHAGAVEGYRTMIAFIPEDQVGIVSMWNSRGVVPAGLVPMVLDDMLGLQHRDWAGLKQLGRRHH
ncbi:serine hydrolase domain-containing protein [Oleiagrimonas sp. C23AA]|uniref:serine hydrolase domain-containing protein n=1 Tax=Oleiagrimonas sp. C23AA TaxID=2719047 RepID=UPI00142364C8|nr:serine hydrolase domain-containing protein [Oleiagrimonas sp. C23AA]NII12119.1 beta-lactamase family protein [Oleiagrimonas sp. C23AA]